MNSSGRMNANLTKADVGEDYQFQIGRVVESLGARRKIPFVSSDFQKDQNSSSFCFFQWVC